MCGIAGIIGGYNATQLDAMLDSQHHRGPDATGKYFDDGFAAFGHNRLAIIDLSVQSNQPFIDVSGRYMIVFNGEIYNYIEIKSDLQNQYVFKTESDTEVLLAAFIIYGKSCLEKFNGMFAFAIWDNQEKKLFAARDRFGVKPFYYSLFQNTFYFSSEIKGLHAAGISKEPNEKVWASYFAYGSYGMPDETFWDQIFQLPGGHSLEVDGCQFELLEDQSYLKALRQAQCDKVKTEYQTVPKHRGLEDFSGRKSLTIEKWYYFEEEVAKQPKDLTFEQAKEHYVALLKDSIHLRFRADVPVGFNVSGGLDSSVLLALVNLQENSKDEFNSKRGLRQVQTDSVLERQGAINAYTFYTNNDDYDELPWVEKMLSKTNNPLTKVLLQAFEVPDL